MAIPYVLPAKVWAQSPNEAIVTGHIGVGGRGSGLLSDQVNRQKSRANVRVAAVAEVDQGRLDRALMMASDANPDAKAYRDFRELLDRDDINVVYIATPPHWHALVCIAAAQAGKDIYCEKPMTKFIAEGRAVVNAVNRYGRMFHIGTGRRYGARHFRKLVMSELLGSPITVHMNRFTFDETWKIKMWSGLTNWTPQPVPPSLDWDLWLGPAPYKPYHPHRCFGSFRGYWDYDGGGFSDMGAHYFDEVQYIIGADDTGPVEVEAKAPWPAHPDAAGMWEEITYKFADGTTVICNCGEIGKADTRDVPYIEGPKGKVLSDRKSTDPPGLFDQLGSHPEPPPMIGWDEALRVRRQPGGNAEVSHRVATLYCLGNISIRTGRKIRWDPQKEQIVGDEEANRFVNVPMRAPWHL